MLDRGAAVEDDVLPPDDGIRAVGHRVARVDDDVRVRSERDGCAVGGPCGHGDPVHRRRVERRRRARGDDRPGGDPAGGELQGDGLDPEASQPAGSREGLDPGAERRLDVEAVQRHQRSPGENGACPGARRP